MDPSRPRPSEVTTACAYVTLPEDARGNERQNWRLADVLLRAVRRWQH
jgi:hypothetical protein